MIVFYTVKKIREFLFDKRIQRILAVSFLVVFASTGWNVLKTYTDGMEMILKVSMQTQNSGAAVLYYDDGKGFNEANKSESFIPGDGRFHELSFKIPFLTTISGLRFDPPSLKTGKGIINRVELVDHHDRLLYRFKPDHLKPIHQINILVQEQNQIHFNTEDGAIDPQIYIHVDKPLQLPRWRIVWEISSAILFEGTIIFLLCTIFIFIWFQWRDKTIATLIVLALLAAGWVLYKELILITESFSLVPQGVFRWWTFVKTVLTWWIGIGLFLTVAIKASCAKVSYDRVSYGVILILIGGYILLSNPFLKIPYDIWDHLLRIASIHDESRSFVFFPEELGYYRPIRPWHKAWAMVFRQIGINDLFIWAKVIHSIQFLFVLGLMLYAIGIIINYLVPSLKKEHGKWLSLLAFLLWMVGNGTYSEEYQQSWLIWYSVTHQAITVPLFWFMIALSVRIISRPETEGKRIILDLVLILGTAMVIARIHPMELLYYFPYIGILFLFHIGPIWHILKKNYWVFLPAVAALAGIIVFVFRSNMSSAFANTILASGWEFHSLIEGLLKTGRSYMAMRLSRFPATFSEIAIFSLVVSFFAGGWIFWNRSIRVKVNAPLFYSQVTAILVFLLIPLTTLPAGLVGFITAPTFVYRFFWGAPWFILLPVVIYLFRQNHKPESGYAWVWSLISGAMMIFIVLSPSLSTGALYANAQSLVNAMDREVMGPQYGQDVVQRLEVIMDQQRPRMSDPTKQDIYYIRGDLGFLVRGCLRKYVYSSRFGTPPRSAFFKQGFDKQYRLVDINIGADFPKDEQMLWFNRFQTSP